MERYAWETTALGPSSDWSAALRTAVDLCLGSRLCGCIYWGEEQLILYNDAYASILGTKHPWALGRPAALVWPEIFHEIGPLLRHTFATGETTGDDDAPLFLNRSGYVEEFYCSFSYTSLVNERGEVEAVCATLPETSAQVIGERRLRTLEQLASGARDARSAREAMAVAAKITQENLFDIPFATFYLWNVSKSEAQLCATSGVDANRPFAWPSIRRGAEGMAGVLADLARRASVSGDTERFDLPRDAIDVPKGAWEVPPNSLVVLPICAVRDGEPSGFVLTGVSPHKRLDSEYLGFFQMLRDQVSAAVSEAHSHSQQESRARHDERLRLARELHDTLLQSVQGMRFLIEAGVAKADSDLPGSLAYFDRALDASIRAVDEGREVLALLRAPQPPSELELPAALERLGRDLLGGAAPRFRFAVRGEPRELDPAERDEVLAVCRESIANALHHASAGVISLELEFSDRIRIEVSDDGTGMPAEVAALGRRGHYGLAGMRERAEGIGAELIIASQPGAGTRVTLRLPRRAND